ncbi:MAG: alpha-2-macroglobulin family protein, partial [Bacteroidales bacterium]|nr:alpha-2-macroglobulin family protein [Bacteroidales bacterium]
ANPLRPSINQTPPDKFVYSQKEFNDLLPKDQYLDEQDYTKWIKGKELKKFTCNDGIIDVNSLSLETGYYVIEATTKDGYGKTVSENFYFNVCVKGDTPTFNKSGIILFTDKTTAQPDDDINILLATSKSALVRVFIVSETRIILDDLIPIKDNKTINIKVSESDRGTIKVFAYSIFDNRQYSESLSIKIPFINKDLDIRLLTEREYIEPNAQEKWKISITNINGIEKNAEVLASMYDMSLDFFITSDYNIGKSGSYSSISRSPFYNSGDFLAYRSYAYRRKIDTKDNIYYTYDNIIEIPEICMSRFFYKTSARNNLSMACCVSDDVIVEAEDTQFVKADTSAGEIAGSEEVPTQRAERSVRRDFRETAFFYPQLKTDEDGTVSFEFTAPESLTKWKFRILAHTKDMSSGYFESEIITQKDIFIQANQPKVLYENDVIDYTARIANLSEKVQSGTAFIKVFDKNGKDITSEVIESNGQKTFSLKSKASQTATWRLTVPKNASILKIRTGADTGSCSDAEEYTIPVLTTKVLITETLPITVNKKGINNYVFKGLRDKFTNNSYSTQSVTLEYSPNPVWYAVQALPYMSDNGNDIFCEQIFGKLYSNLIAGYIIKHNPKIEEVYKQIAASTPDEFISELEKNQELKDILLSETPWVLEAEDEQQQRERLALLFDYNQMSYNISTFANKLSSMQQSDGGFPWIQGMTYPSFYTTLYIITGFCHLMDINIINYGDNGTIKNIIAKGVSFLDSEIVETYDTMKSDKTLDSYHISSSMVSYLYMRSFISDKIVVSNSTKEAYDFFYNKALKGYNSLDLSSQAMAAILFQRSNNNKEAQFLMQSFNERALHSEELGMYWRDLQSTYSYNASIEAAALMIECYAALTNDSGSINEIQRWLLNRKRTTIWETTRATTEAIYALLIGNSAKIAGDYANDAVVIGKKSVDMEGAIPGSGYVKASWIGEEVTKDFANISIEKTSDGTAWASVYWQYLTDYANVTSASAGLSVERKIMRGSLAGDKIVYSEYPSISVIRATDNVIVRMIVKVDRDMEYVHLKDILPACFIPKETISGYRYENGLWYYLNIKDESVNYYIERLSKGTYVIDYHVNIQQSGKFNAGISKIQCMYAPEFCGQSEGSIIFVKD